MTPLNRAFSTIMIKLSVTLDIDTEINEELIMGALQARLPDLPGIMQALSSQYRQGPVPVKAVEDFWELYRQLSHVSLFVSGQSRSKAPKIERDCQPMLVVLLLEACMPETIAQVILKPGQLEHVRWDLVVPIIECEFDKRLPDCAWLDHHEAVLTKARGTKAYRQVLMAKLLFTIALKHNWSRYHHQILTEDLWHAKLISWWYPDTAVSAPTTQEPGKWSEDAAVWAAAYMLNKCRDQFLQALFIQSNLLLASPVKEIASMCTEPVLQSLIARSMKQRLSIWAAPLLRCLNCSQLAALLDLMYRHICCHTMLPRRSTATERSCSSYGYHSLPEFSDHLRERVLDKALRDVAQAYSTQLQILLDAVKLQLLNPKRCFQKLISLMMSDDPTLVGAASAIYNSQIELLKDQWMCNEEQVSVPAIQSIIIDLTSEAQKDYKWSAPDLRLSSGKFKFQNWDVPKSKRQDYEQRSEHLNWLADYYSQGLHIDLEHLKADVEALDQESWASLLFHSI